MAFKSTENQPKSSQYHMSYTDSWFQEVDSDSIYTDSDSDYECDSIFSSEDDGSDFEEERPVAPFWYGNEEQPHLAKVASIYTTAINKEKNNCAEKNKHPLACSYKFVGRIFRRPLVNLNQQDKFITLDILEIFTKCPFKSTCSPALSIDGDGETLTFLTKTVWNEDGLPKKCTVIKEEEIGCYIINSRSASYIHCFPIWQSPSEYYYKVGNEKEEIEYAQHPFHFTRNLFPSHFNPYNEDCGN